uniref:Uncharacterized protein n=1 Tax=Rhizophora mucronata TaxID=61149 RepID=A0A2P2NPR3_RHIMU
MLIRTFLFLNGIPLENLSFCKLNYKKKKKR